MVKRGKVSKKCQNCDSFSYYPFCSECYKKTKKYYIVSFRAEDCGDIDFGIIQVPNGKNHGMFIDCDGNESKKWSHFELDDNAIQVSGYKLTYEDVRTILDSKIGRYFGIPSTSNKLHNLISDEISIQFSTEWQRPNFATRTRCKLTFTESAKELYSIAEKSKDFRKDSMQHGIRGIVAYAESWDGIYPRCMSCFEKTDDLHLCSNFEHMYCRNS